MNVKITIGRNVIIYGEGSIALPPGNEAGSVLIANSATPGDASFKTLEDAGIAKQDDLVQLAGETVKEKAGTNLADQSKLKAKGMVRSDGSITFNSTDAYAVTDYIPVLQNTSITINHDPSSVNGYFALYDENKQVIPNSITKNRTLPYVDGAKYAVFSVLITWTDLMINYGDMLPYQKYNPVAGYLGADYFGPEFFISENIKGKAIFKSINRYSASCGELWIDPQYRDTATDGLNYHFKIFSNNIYVRCYVNSQAPYIWNCTVPLPNKNNYHGEPIALTVTNAGGGVPIGTIVGYITFINTPAWDEMDGRAGDILSDNVWNIGNFPIIYTKMQELEYDDSVGMEKGIDVIIPDEFIAVVDDNLQIFHRGYIRAINPYNYYIEVVCGVGKNFPRYFEFKPTTAHIGNSYSITFRIKRNDLSIVVQKTSTIKVIAKAVSPSVNKNVLVFGASATANGYFVSELNRRLATPTGDGNDVNPTGLNLNNITFVGRKTGTAKNISLEATGGWSWLTYLGEGRPAYRFTVTGVTLLNIGNTYSVNGVVMTITEINITEGTGNIRCTYEGSATVPANGTLSRLTGSGDSTITYTSVESESYNPFWNNGKLDFINYANLYCGGSIDVLIAHCGANDFSSGRVGDDLFNNYIKPFARSFHADFPNAKFIISSLPLPDCRGGMGANYGASTTLNYFISSINFWEFSKSLNSMVKDSEFKDYVSQARVIQEFDNENGYPYNDANVNNRIAVTEKRGSNGVHPTQAGSYMVADSIYREINRIL